MLVLIKVASLNSLPHLLGSLSRTTSSVDPVKNPWRVLVLPAPLCLTCFIKSRDVTDMVADVFHSWEWKWFPSQRAAQEAVTGPVLTVLEWAGINCSDD